VIHAPHNTGTRSPNLLYLLFTTRNTSLEIHAKARYHKDAASCFGTGICSSHLKEDMELVGAEQQQHDHKG